jgi:MFS family permease
VFVVWFVGVMLGALSFGWLADRVGRRRLFVATLVLYSIAAVCTAAAPSYAVFMLFRFVTALGVGGEYSAVASSISEFVPDAGRPLIRPGGRSGSGSPGPSGIAAA